MLNLPKFLFLNGPPGSGKSTLATLICDSHPQCWRESFAEPIRQMMYAVFWPGDGPIHFQLDLRDGEVKKQKMPVDRGDEDTLTIRQAMISFSEDWMKPKFGSSVFGKLCYLRCKEQEDFYSSFVIDDSGFQAEAQAILHEVGAADCHLIRLHRECCSFDGDSRSYLSLPGVQTLDLSNNGAPDEMMSTLQLELGNI